MAKKRGPSIHSRAARRATSPGIDTDKSLKAVKPPRKETLRPSVLAIHQSAGVSKKTKRGRNLSAKARRRHEKNLEMAEAVSERTNTKLEKSLGRDRNVQGRRKAWDDINKLAEMEENAAEMRDWEDVEDDENENEHDKKKPVGFSAAVMDGDDMDGAGNSEPVTASEPAVTSAPLDDDLDEIL